ncbi:Uu.00g017410.m01.CDS01 [Anthostomella pinea]|uniref:Uu.00g017410.m01.CDS01 n=1 Tax=Anthostomella pinea TaxID=933095 RepID=A0AAI8YND4_9PEZI|nr:Uu.00g017410.m01.CDS01 [Anthostomella pinea]
MRWCKDGKCKARRQWPKSREGTPTPVHWKRRLCHGEALLEQVRQPFYAGNPRTHEERQRAEARAALISDFSNYPEQMTFAETHHFLTACFDNIDRYFYTGAFSSGRVINVRLILREGIPYSRWAPGVEKPRHASSHDYTKRRIWRIDMCRTWYGGQQPSKLALLRILIHEMTHLYIWIFHRCPDERQRLTLGRNMRSPLWRRCNQVIARKVAEFDPVFAVYVDDEGRFGIFPERSDTWLYLEDVYLRTMARYPGFRRDYNQEPMWVRKGLSMTLEPRPNPPLMTGLTSLRYPEYIDYVRDRVPGYEKAYAAGALVLLTGLFSPEAIVAILSLVVALPPSVLVFLQWRRYYQRQKAEVDRLPTTQAPPPPTPSQHVMLPPSLHRAAAGKPDGTTFEVVFAEGPHSHRFTYTRASSDTCSQ